MSNWLTASAAAAGSYIYIQDSKTVLFAVLLRDPGDVATYSCSFPSGGTSLTLRGAARVTCGLDGRWGPEAGKQRYCIGGKIAKQKKTNL